MHSIQMILLIAAVLAFGCVISSPLAWARHGHQHFQRPISHSNHAAILRYYSTPYQLRPPIRHFHSSPHFDWDRHDGNRHDKGFDDHNRRHPSHDDRDVFIRWEN